MTLSASASLLCQACHQELQLLLMEALHVACHQELQLLLMEALHVTDTYQGRAKVSHVQGQTLIRVVKMLVDAALLGISRRSAYRRCIAIKIWAPSENAIGSMA